MKNKRRPAPGAVCAVSLAALFGLCLLAEGGLRCAGFRFDPYKHYKRFGANFEADEIRHYRQDPRLFWTLRPRQTIREWWGAGARINAKGFRGAEFSWSKPAGVLRVLCLGDSGTFGWELKDEETYPRRLEALLRARLPDRAVEVVNMGVPGYSSHQGLILFEDHAARMRPDVVIFSFGRNDHNDTVYLTDRQRKSRSGALLGVHNSLLNTRLYQWIYKIAALRRYRVNPNGFAILGERQTVRVPLEEYEENLTAAVRTADASGIRLVFVPRAQRPEYNAAMRRVARDRGAAYLDLPALGRDRGLLDFSRGEHPGAEAYARLARLLVDPVLLAPQGRQ